MAEQIKTISNSTLGTTEDRVQKRGSEFSSVERMAKWAINPTWVDGFYATKDSSVEETEVSNLWRVMSASSEDVLNDIYKSIKNIPGNIGDLDLCTVQKLKDQAKMFGMDGIPLLKMDLNFPVEIRRMVDIFSINKAHLRGYLSSDNGMNRRVYGKTTQASEEFWSEIVESCTDDLAYRKFIRNTFYKTLEGFVNLRTADGKMVIWRGVADGETTNATSAMRYSTNLFFSRTEYTNDVETTHGVGPEVVGTETYEQQIYNRKLELGVPKYFAEKYCADEILLGNRRMYEFSDAEQEIIRMEIVRRKALWENTGVNRYTYIREIKVLSYIRFVTMFANAIYDSVVYDIDNRKSEILGIDDSKYLIKSTGGEYSVDTEMIGTAADILTDYCINLSYLRESMRVQAQRNMLKGTKSLLVDSIREMLAKNVYSNHNGCDNFWRQTNVDSIIGMGVSMPEDLAIDIIEYVDNTKYTNIKSLSTDESDKTNPRFWQVSGVQGDLSADDILEFYNKLTEYKDPWHINECADDTDEKKDPKHNLYQHLNYVFNSGALAATVDKRVFDSDKVALNLANSVSDFYSFDELRTLLVKASKPEDVPNLLTRIYFDYNTAASDLVVAFKDIYSGEEGSDGWKRYHDPTTVSKLISGYKTPGAFIGDSKSIFPYAYFDLMLTSSYLAEEIVYRDKVTTSYVSKDTNENNNATTTVNVLSERIATVTEVTDLTTTTTLNDGVVSSVVTTKSVSQGDGVTTIDDKPYIDDPTCSSERSFQRAYANLIANKDYQSVDMVRQAFPLVENFPTLADRVFGDASRFRHDNAISTINLLDRDFNYDAVEAVKNTENYNGSMVHEDGKFGSALADYTADISYGNRTFANSQNKVHPSIQTHAFVAALVEYVHSYHSIVKYIDVEQPDFETYSQTVIDRVDKIGNTINFWLNSINDFSGYTTDYEKGGSDADPNIAISGPFNLRALQLLLDGKSQYIEGLRKSRVIAKYEVRKSTLAAGYWYVFNTETKDYVRDIPWKEQTVSIFKSKSEADRVCAVYNETSWEYYYDASDGTYVLTDLERQLEIDNIQLYYDAICKLATKEIAKFGKDKYGNSYTLYKDRGHRNDRDALGQLWIRKYGHPLSFPAVVVDEDSGKLSNNSQISLTDNDALTDAIYEQYKYPNKSYGDIDLSGTGLIIEKMSDLVGHESGYSAKCLDLDWSNIGSARKAELMTSGYHSIENGEFDRKFFISDVTGKIIAEGQEDKIWDAGRTNPGYIKSGDDEYGYVSNVITKDYVKGSVILDMNDYKSVDFSSQNEFVYTMKPGSSNPGVLTFVILKDDANAEGHRNNYFLDSSSGSEPITYHNYKIKGVFTIQLKRDAGTVGTVEYPVDSVTVTMQHAAEIDEDEELFDRFDFGSIKTDDVTGRVMMSGTMVVGGDDTNILTVGFFGNEDTYASNGTVVFTGNGQNYGKYYDFDFNETLDVLALNAKSTHFSTADKAKVIAGKIDEQSASDGTAELGFLRDTQHNKTSESPKNDDSTSEAYVGKTRQYSIHAGNASAGGFVYAIFADIEEKCTSTSGGYDTWIPTGSIAFRCTGFGNGTLFEDIFTPQIKYAAYRTNGKYHFRTTTDGENVYVAFCSELPKDGDKVGNYVSGYDGFVAGSVDFSRERNLGYANGVTIVGFASTETGLRDNGDVRYVVKNETLGYYPQYPGIVGRNLVYANASMRGEDRFGFELMFENHSNSFDDPRKMIEIEIDGSTLSGFGHEIVKDRMYRYGRDVFFETTDGKNWLLHYDSKNKSSSITEVNLGTSAFYALDISETESEMESRGSSAFDPKVLCFRNEKLYSIPVGGNGGDTTYSQNRPFRAQTIMGYVNATETPFDVYIDDSTVTSIDGFSGMEFSVREVSNIDSNGNFLILCDGNVILSCHCYWDDKYIVIKTVNYMDNMEDEYAQITNTVSGEFVVYPNEFKHSKIDYAYGRTSTSGFLEIGRYTTEYTDSVAVKDIAIFRGTVFVLFDDRQIDHIFKVTNCFVENGVVQEYFTLLPTTTDGYIGFSSDDSCLVIVPSDLEGTVLIYNSQTEEFDKAYQLSKLIKPVKYQDCSTMIGRIVDGKLRIMFDKAEVENSAQYEYTEAVADMGSGTDYAILELDKDFPILVTYVDSDDGPSGDSVILKFQCIFNTSEKGRLPGGYQLKSWPDEDGNRRYVTFAYNKSNETGLERGAISKYDDDNEYMYGDSRLYRITATGQKKFIIERLYREADYTTGEFDENGYLSFIYNVKDLPVHRKNRKFDHLNREEFQYTVSGPFSDKGIETKTQFVVPPAYPDELSGDAFQGLSVSKDFSTYWLSGTIDHLRSCVEPNTTTLSGDDYLIDSNLQFGRGTIICSCESMFKDHVNLECRFRILSLNDVDNSKYVTNTDSMFKGDTSLLLPEVDITDSHVIDTEHMFQGCLSAKLDGATIPSGAIYVKEMYDGCSSTTFTWEQVIPCTIIDSLSAVYQNCYSGTFDNTEFASFPRFIVDRTIYSSVEEAMSEAMGIEGEDGSGNGHLDRNFDLMAGIDRESYRLSGYVMDGHIEYVMDISTGKMVRKFVPSEAGRYVKPEQDYDPEGGYVATMWDDRLLSFDMLMTEGETVQPLLLNFGNYLLGSDKRTNGRFVEAKRSRIIGDYMFHATPRFRRQDIKFGNVSYNLISAIGMFKDCGYEREKPVQPEGNTESGRFIGDETQESAFGDRLFSFDMDANQPTLNFSSAEGEIEDNGLHTMDGVIDLKLCENAERMFQHSGFIFKDTICYFGSKIQSIAHMFRDCRWMTTIAPRVQFAEGKMRITNSGKGVPSTSSLPRNMSALYSHCTTILTADIEMLGEVDVANTVTTEQIEALGIDMSYMFYGATSLKWVSGKLNRYATSLVGMFAGCTSLYTAYVETFLRQPLVNCDVTGMFYGCGFSESDKTMVRNRLGVGTNPLVHGDPFDDPITKVPYV